MVEIDVAVALAAIFILKQAFTVLGISFGGILQPEYLAKSARDGGALEPDLAIVHAVDVSDEHVHATVVAAVRHGQHVVKSASARQQRHDSPERATAKMCSPHPLELPGARHLDHGHPGPDVDKQIRVDIRSGLGKLHGLDIGVAVGEDFVGDFGNEKIEAW